MWTSYTYTSLNLMQYKFDWIKRVNERQRSILPDWACFSLRGKYTFEKKRERGKAIKNIPPLTSDDELDHSFRRIPVVHETLVHTAVGGGDGMQLQRIIFQRQRHSVLFCSPHDSRTSALILEQPHPVCPPLEHQHQWILRHSRTPQRDVLPRLHDDVFHQRIHGICEHRSFHYIRRNIRSKRYRCDKNKRDVVISGLQQEMRIEERIGERAPRRILAGSGFTWVRTISAQSE